MAPTQPIHFMPGHDASGTDATTHDGQRLAAAEHAEGVAESAALLGQPAPVDQTPSLIDQPTARAMRESQRLIAIGRLTAEIAHEINNPLEAVGNLIYLALHEQGVPGRAIDFLRTAERELERVVSISKQTLSFSRESAKAVPVYVVDLMDEVVSMYSRRIASKRLALIREYSATDPVIAFPGEIRQVLSNLVTNAIEACSHGGSLRLRVRDARHQKQPGVRITVADNGVGIPEAARKRLGEMFFSTKGESGTGLGLWVIRAIVSRYGGTMRLRSSTGEDHGTCFSIFLPSAGSPALHPAEPARKSQPDNVTEISRHPHHANSPHGAASRSRTDSVKREG